MKYVAALALAVLCVQFAFVAGKPTEITTTSNVSVEPQPPITTTDNSTTSDKPTTPTPITTKSTTVEPTTITTTTTTPASTTPASTTAPTTTPTTTPAPTPSTPAPTPAPTPATSTVVPDVTTTTTVTPPVPRKNSFDGPSFIGGIVLSLGLVAIGFVGWKYYVARSERNYRTL